MKMSKRNEKINNEVFKLSKQISKYAKVGNPTACLIEEKLNNIKNELRNVGFYLDENFEEKFDNK